MTLVRRARGALNRAVAVAGRLTPREARRRRQWRRERPAGEAALATLAATTRRRFDGTVLLDAMWDNPNYWLRASLLRAGLGLGAGREIGLLGADRAKEAARTLARIGVPRTVALGDLGGDAARHRRDAERMLRTTKTPEAILRWRLPDGFPADIVYDGILRRQRLASVDPTDPSAMRYLAHALASIEAAARVIERERPDLVVLTHVVNPQFAALAWFALNRGVPVVLAYGNYGVARFAKLRTPADMRDTMDRPGEVDLSAVTASRAQQLAAIGETYLDKRLGGRTDDLGARYAFRLAGESVTRTAIAERFGWDPARPIVGVYASNWFDYPHAYGMTAFRDFLDWIEATTGAARASTHVNWLFKAHPCDQWYGGVTLADLLPPSSAPDHVRLVPVAWSGSALLAALDGVITYFGTVGVEAAATGKPVLVADRGWYHDAGFVRWPRSRAEYLDALATDWWKDVDTTAAAHRARMFAGWYFGRPAWQQRFVLQDDTLQEAIWGSLPGLLAGGGDEIARELDLIGTWFDSDRPHYHTFKMSRAEAFVA